MLGEAVIVAGDGAGADIGARADARVADIGEVVDLGAFGDVGLLDLDEIADMGLGPRAAPGRSRANGPTVASASMRAPTMWQKPLMVTLSPMTTPGPMTTLGSMITSLPMIVSWLRNTVSGAMSVAPSAMISARSRCCITASAWASSAREFTPSTSSASDRNMRGLEPVRVCERHRVGQIELPLGVVVADARQEIGQGLAAAKCHNARIAQSERALLGARVFLLANADQAPAIVEQQPAIARGVVGLKADHHEIGAIVELVATPTSVSGGSSGVSP